MPRGSTISMKMNSRKPITGAETDVQAIVTGTLDKNDLTTALIRGDNPGIANNLIDKDGGRELYDVVVQTDVEYLKLVLRRAVPTANVEPVPAANNAFVLTGTVAHGRRRGHRFGHGRAASATTSSTPCASGRATGAAWT